MKIRKEAPPNSPNLAVINYQISNKNIQKMTVNKDLVFSGYLKDIQTKPWQTSYIIMFLMMQIMAFNCGNVSQLSYDTKRQRI